MYRAAAAKKNRRWGRCLAAACRIKEGMHMKPRRAAGVAMLSLALIASAALPGCGGGTSEPAAIRPDDGAKGLSDGLKEDEVACESTPDVESFLVRDEVSGKQIPDGGATQDPAVQLRITLREPLAKECVVRVLRNDMPQPRGLTACDRSCVFTDRLPADGTYEYRVRTEARGTPNTVGEFQGNLSDTYSITLDRVAPQETVDAISGPNGKVETRDTKPTIGGTVSASLGAGKFVRLQRGSSEEPTDFQLLALLVVRGEHKWSYQETNSLLGENATKATYVYRAQVVDAAGNVSAARDLKLTINRTDPYTKNKAQIGTVNGSAPTDGAVLVSKVKRPSLAGTIDKPLTKKAPNGDGDDQILVVYRDGVRVGEASIENDTQWAFASTADLPDGNYVFRLRVEKKDDTTEFGDSVEVTVPIDATPPIAPVIRGFSNSRPFQFQPGFPTVFNLLGQTTQEVGFANGAVVTDPDPRILVEYTIAKGETLTIEGPGVATKIATEGAATASFQLPRALNRPPLDPTTTVQSRTYKATQEDAATNKVETTFTFTVQTVDCNQGHARASTKPELLAHFIWGAGLPPGISSCVGCHATRGQYVAIAPTRRGSPEFNNQKEPNSYWCRKVP
jgi:hypothetical protein